jgi:hypothetical protein
MSTRCSERLNHNSASPTSVARGRGRGRGRGHTGPFSLNLEEDLLEDPHTYPTTCWRTDAYPT